MLTQTHDPIADFVNAVCSDVIAFAATISYEDFLKLTHKLSDLATYSQLATRSERIGYTVTKVSVLMDVKLCCRLLVVHGSS